MKTQDTRIRNVSELQVKKQERMRLIQIRSTKQGQIRAFHRQKFLANKEIEVEQEELRKIDEQIEALDDEIKALT